MFLEIRKLNQELAGGIKESLDFTLEVGMKWHLRVSAKNGPVFKKKREREIQR